MGYFLPRSSGSDLSPAVIEKLKGVVELDECFIGGKEANKHEHKKLRAGRGPVGKTAVLGMRERGGRTILAPMEERNLQTATERIHTNVELGTQLYTDDHLMFSDLDGLFFRHDTVNHSAGEYARGAASTNSIESVWAVLKRGVYGVYHHISPKAYWTLHRRVCVASERRQRQEPHV